MAASYLARSFAESHRPDTSVPDGDSWQSWKRHPARARIWFVKGGPGQGKSTLGQYLCQIQRAAVMLGPNAPNANYALKNAANDVKVAAEAAGLWPLSPRVPISIELKNYAHWFGKKNQDGPRGVLSFLAERLTIESEQQITTGFLKKCFESGRWVFVFDGLDEVPSDVKGEVAQNVIHFADDVLIEVNADAFILCTSRPQGYAGQFSDLNSAEIILPFLAPKEALHCAIPVLKFNQADSVAKSHVEVLHLALNSPAVQEIMTTPLQAHIMAVVVRDGGRPPDRKWALFSNFYATIKRREANKISTENRLSTLLRDGDRLLKALHNKLGFELHSRAETSEGAQTFIVKSEFRELVLETATDLLDTDVSDRVETLMEATTDRLVLVSTPESGNEFRFDIRPLQEFFAAEYMYDRVQAEVLRDRMRVIGDGPHWNEVMHFLLSALVENDRQTELSVAVDVLGNINDGGSELPRRFLFRV